MFGSNRVITIDVGASKLVVAEYEAEKGQPPQLLNYGIKTQNLAPEDMADPAVFLSSGVREIMRERGIKPAHMYMTISGQSVFPRYVKLPPVTRDKVMQMVQYEAEQNVPFPINEVVWDYQLITDTDDGELHVMLVAAKIDSVTEHTGAAESVGLEPEIVDVAPMALYNAVRFNYPELPECTMVLDIGARSSNLIFIEGSRIFSRSIPVAGNAITQEIMKEFDIPFTEAENLKIEHGFVSFGGVYAGPDDEVADRVSKIIRNVVTRLHAEVNRSINFYRSQQGGTAPEMILLTGGSSVISHMDTFFREKIQVEVEYLNPFNQVPVNPELDLEAVGQDIHMLGEVTGLALRGGMSCPVEINLMPPEIVKKKVFRSRQPFFAASAVGVIMIMFCWWIYFHKMGNVLTQRGQSVDRMINTRKTYSIAQKEAKAKIDVEQKKVDDLLGVVKKRTYWAEALTEINKALLDGMWITSLRPVAEDEKLPDQKAYDIVELKVRGFDDSLRNADKPNEANAQEIFRDNLRKSPFFSTNTAIVSMAMGRQYDRLFTVWVYLGEAKIMEGPEDGTQPPPGGPN